MRNKILALLFVVILGIGYIFVSNYDLIEQDVIVDVVVKEDGYYTSKDDVALYINTYDKLPNNYITKKEAAKLGYKPSEGNLWDVSDKKSIGGDKLFNRENLLPVIKGRIYFEADIDYKGGYRNKKRIVFSNDGLIYYSDNHYDSFTLLYGDE